MAAETKNNTFNSQSTSYINSSGKNVLKYIPPDTIVLDMPFILTRGKRLSKNIPYMKLEKLVVGNDMAAIRLLDFYDKVRKEGLLTLTFR